MFGGQQIIFTSQGPYSSFLMKAICLVLLVKAGFYQELAPW